jgi:hypothetical protein
VTLLQAGGSWRNKPPEPQPDDERRGMRLAYVGISLCTNFVTVYREILFTVVASLSADQFLIFHCTKMLISFRLVLFVGTVGAVLTGIVCACARARAEVGGWGTLCCDTVLHLQSIYLTDMISGISVPVTIVKCEPCGF